MTVAKTSYLTAHLNDGSKLSITSPQQVPHERLADHVREAIAAGQVAVGLDGGLFVVPTGSVKYLQVHPAPEKLPGLVLQGARLSDQ